MSEPRLTRVAQVALTARDLPRATAFYRDKLGLEHLFDAGGMSFLDCGGTRLMLSVPTPGEFDHPSSPVYLDTPDLPAMHAALVARGVAFEREPFRVARLADTELWMAFLRDSEGNLLGIQSEVPIA
jgi:catechol 2,3-dioxygenase-like lactoylglutathione lyase family enzyme